MDLSSDCEEQSGIIIRRTLCNGISESRFENSENDSLKYLLNSFAPLWS
jgi:hypothetical protein